MTQDSPVSGHDPATAGEAPGGPRYAIGTWIGSVAYFALVCDSRWYAHDDGGLAHSAWRVLSGQLPHRDYDDMHTGLLTYLHAGAMSGLGVDLLSPRILLLSAFALWVPAVWAIASRFATARGAALCTALAVCLGPTVYPSPMPSWYNLFLATWSVWALLRWNEAGARRWLFFAGAAAGLSVLMKMSASTRWRLGSASCFIESSCGLAPSEERSSRSRGRYRSWCFSRFCWSDLRRRSLHGSGTWCRRLRSALRRS